MKYRMNRNRLDIIIDAEFAGKTVGDFFDAYRQSRKARYLLLQNENVLLNRVPVRKEDVLLEKGNTLSIIIEAEEPGFPIAPEECTIVYEDDFVYVAHKDPGLIIHSDSDDVNCLAAQAAAYQQNHGIISPVRYIHRLDRDTAGLVLFVKFPFFQAWYDEQLESKKIERHYYAICTGRARIKQGFTFNQPIGRDRHVNGKYRVSETGKEALTKARCIAREDDYLLMSCQLQTGRTHQIRVHLSASNHPIVNDPLYGLPTPAFRHMGLWADRIVFTDPLSHEVCTAVDTFNEDYACFADAIRKQQ